MFDIPVIGVKTECTFSARQKYKEQQNVIRSQLDSNENLSTLVWLTSIFCCCRSFGFVFSQQC